MEDVSCVVTSKPGEEWTTVTPEQFARAKELFIDLLDKTNAERESKLNSLNQSEAEVVKEVRGLLAKHFSRTILMPTGKVSKTTVQSRSFSTLGLQRINSNVVGGLLPLATAIGTALFLMIVGWYLQAELVRRTRVEFDAVLTSMADQKSRHLLQWVKGNELRMQDWGRNPELQKLVMKLDQLTQDTSLSESARCELLAKSEEQSKVKCVFEDIVNKPLLVESERKNLTVQANERLQLKYAIWNRSTYKLADWQYKNPDSGLGTLATPNGASVLSRVFGRKATSVELPRPSADTLTKDYPLEISGQYVMFFVPIFSPDDDTQVIGVMMIRNAVYLEEVEELISKFVLRDSNCYLLDDRGAIATKAKQLETLNELPVFSNTKIVRGVRVVEARDPGGELLKGYKPSNEVNEWAWTKPGKTISQPKTGSDVLGYRDYRGVEVVGAWHWIESMQRLLVLEVPKTEAFKTQVFIERAFRFMYGLPLFISLIIGALSLRRAMQTSSMTNKSLGPYILKDKIGEGGLGIVYSAEHKLLGRTAAIKLIKEPLSNSGSLKRFNREVRLAAKLNHPNTVSIYDFGVSRDGLLYCAMEMVYGVNLAHFISYDPTVSIDRCIWILRQISGAIEEAHDIGLIHRDIKPQNIMICQKGQLADLVKVVDFGLAKTMADNVARDVTATRVLIGTPGFIAPERMETPWIADPRIDIFAFGVLGVYLLTSKVPMIGATNDSLLMTLQLGRFADLCNDIDFRNFVLLLAQCISPDPADRPKSMRDVSKKLEVISSHFPWNEDLSEKWWRANGDDLIAYSRSKESNQ